VNETADAILQQLALTGMSDYEWESVVQVIVARVLEVVDVLQEEQGPAWADWWKGWRAKYSQLR